MSLFGMCSATMKKELPLRFPSDLTMPIRQTRQCALNLFNQTSYFLEVNGFVFLFLEVRK